MLIRCSFLLVLVAAPAWAQPEEAETPTSEVPAPRRQLGGHTFMPAVSVADPFVSTNATINMGAAYAWIDGPGFDIHGNMVGERSYRAEGLAQTGSFQVGVTDWLGFRVTGGGGLNGGNDARSALVVGMVNPLTVGAGATASWQLGSYVRLGAIMDFVYSYTKVIDPLSAVQGSLTSGEVDTALVSQKLDGYAIQPGAAVAIAPAKAVGILATAQYMWDGLYGDVSDTQLNYVILGASAQLDLRPTSAQVPIGFLASYRTQIGLESGTRSTHTVEGGLFYTGRRDLSLGIDAQWRWFDLRPDTRMSLDTRQLISVFLIRYHWN